MNRQVYIYHPLFFIMICHICLKEIKDATLYDKLELCSECFSKVEEIAKTD